MSHPRSAPFRDGFAALWHEPMLLPAELAWRWCFGFAALALGFISLALFLDSLKLSRADEFLLRTWQPGLLSNALRHIFRGSLSRFLMEQTVLILGVTLLWSFAAAAGRAATLRRLVAMFSQDEEPEHLEWHFAAIFAVTLLRVLWSLIAIAVTLGFLAWGIVMVQNEHAVRAAIALSFGIGLATLFGIVLNWYFGVAPLFCVRSGAGAMDALDLAVEFSSLHAGRLFLISVGFLAVRLVWAATLFLAFLSPLSLNAQIGPRWVMCLMAAVALVYFAGADLLRLARLGAYASLAEDGVPPVAEIAPPEFAPPPEIAPMLGLA